MYEEFETKTSYKYLKEVIKNLAEPICILGGWAVFFHVNKKFEKAQGRPYLGSRDIDLGFNMGAGDALAQTIKTLTEKLRFESISFRLLKEIHTETEEEIKKGEKVHAHFTFPLFVDLIVDSIPKDFKKTFGFDPIDEPLLNLVFSKKEHIILNEFDKKLLLPKPELLLAMKINSLPDRDKQHKKIKDICDIFALAWYSDIQLNDINLVQFIPKNNLKKCGDVVTNDDYRAAEIQIGHSAEEIKRVFNMILPI
ncbi:MAG: hypothetical protein AABW88_03875 [Nanoarchaeota archaeon]